MSCFVSKFTRHFYYRQQNQDYFQTNNSIFTERKIQSMKKTLILTFLLSILGLCGEISAQVCSGNIGENIFTDGDFGSGTANLLTPDPMIAPGV